MEPAVKVNPTLAPQSRRPRSPQRLSVRLPLGLAARLAAICEMHKEKSRSQIVTDLLSIAISQIANAAPTPSSGADQATFQGSQTPVYLLNGPFSEFHHLVVKHHRQMERELAGEDLAPLAAPDPYDLNDEEA